MNVEFLVPDMTCGHCVRTITQAVQSIEPLAQVVAQTDTKRVSINGSSDAVVLESLALEQAIRQAGYTPELI